MRRWKQAPQIWRLLRLVWKVRNSSTGFSDWQVMQYFRVAEQSVVVVMRLSAV